MHIYTLTIPVQDSLSTGPTRDLHRSLTADGNFAISHRVSSCCSRESSQSQSKCQAQGQSEVPSQAELFPLLDVPCRETLRDDKIAVAPAALYKTPNTRANESNGESAYQQNARASSSSIKAADIRPLAMPYHPRSRHFVVLEISNGMSYFNTEARMRCGVSP